MKITKVIFGALLLLAPFSLSAAVESTLIPNDFLSVEPINRGWSFSNERSGGEVAVDLPHTWNNKDGQDGGGDYLRTESSYTKRFEWREEYRNRRVYVEFMGVNSQCEVSLNGVLLGRHRGGYTAFRYDMSDHLLRGENELVVKVDNRHNEAIAPLTGDFTFFGGIYRSVNIVVANPIHIDLMDSGSSGLYLTTRDVTHDSATLNIRANIVNDTDKSRKVTLRATLRHGDAFEAIDQIPDPDFDAVSMTYGEQVGVVNEVIVVPARGSVTFARDIEVDKPRLWSGREDPYRYVVDVDVLERGRVVDQRSSYVGFRYFEYSNKGFFLNGKHYPLRGVCRHQDRRDKGNAISFSDHDEDFAFIYEIGANSLRLAHYPHSPYFYDLCDRYGIVVWAEIPFVDHVGKDAEFDEVTMLQLKEMIRQNYNRPSITMWGLQNEVRAEYDTQMRDLMTRLNDLAHSEDATRPTVQASNHGKAYNWSSDLFAWNSYPGWYGEGRMGRVMDNYIGREQPTGVSEYGYGASIIQHELTTKRPVPSGVWHPEEYQSYAHELAIADINARPETWGTYVWNMFDFAADLRREGDMRGINDKGLMTHDRGVKKDAFYLYKANWNPATTLYITSRRMNPIPFDSLPVTVYSNCDAVTLYINGKSAGRIVREDAPDCIYKWQDVALDDGRNSVTAIGEVGDQKFFETILWYRPIVKGETTLPTSTKGAECSISAVRHVIDHAAKVIYITDADLKSVLTTDAFLARFKIVGYTATLNADSYFVQVGDTLMLTTPKGDRLSYTIKIAR